MEITPENYFSQFWNDIAPPTFSGKEDTFQEYVYKKRVILCEAVFYLDIL